MIRAVQRRLTACATWVRLILHQSHAARPHLTRDDHPPNHDTDVYRHHKHRSGDGGQIEVGGHVIRATRHEVHTNPRNERCRQGEQKRLDELFLQRKRDVPPLDASDIPLVHRPNHRCSKQQDCHGCSAQNTRNDHISIPFNGSIYKPSRHCKHTTIIA